MTARKLKGKQVYFLSVVLDLFYDHKIKEITARDFYKLLPNKRPRIVSNCLFRLTHIWGLLKQTRKGHDTTYRLATPNQRVEFYRDGRRFRYRWLP